MTRYYFYILSVSCLIFILSCDSKENKQTEEQGLKFNEPFRPQYHFVSM